LIGAGAQVEVVMGEKSLSVKRRGWGPLRCSSDNSGWAARTVAEA